MLWPGFVLPQLLNLWLLLAIVAGGLYGLAVQPAFQQLQSRQELALQDAAEKILAVLPAEDTPKFKPEVKSACERLADRYQVRARLVPALPSKMANDASGNMSVNGWNWDYSPPNSSRAALRFVRTFPFRSGTVSGQLELAAVDHASQLAARFAWLMAGLTFLTSVVVAWRARRWSNAIESIQAACDAVTAGEFGCRAAVDRGDALGKLADSVNKLCRELDARIARLIEGNSRLSAILSGMVEGVLVLDGEDRVNFANEQARKLLRLGGDRLEGKPLMSAVRNHALHALLQQQHGVADPAKAEIQLDGEDPRVLSAYAVGSRDQANRNTLLILDDVTDVRRLESMRRDFVANVSHELKTPLAAILAYTETLLAGALEDSQYNREFLSKIQESATRLERLIQDLLSLARIESGEEVFQIEDVSTRQMIDDCLKDHALAAQAKSIQLVNRGGDPKLCFKADDEGCWQIFRNLVDNAIKYTSEGGLVSVGWNTDQDMIRVDVTDNGIGISPADQARLFERFYRVDRARSRELGGTGLGLAIVKHLCLAFGGQVRLTSQLGQGSTFSVLLPRGEDLP